MIPSCLTLSNIRYISRVKRSNPGKRVAPSPIPQCSSYWKGSLLVALAVIRRNIRGKYKKISEIDQLDGVNGVSRVDQRGSHLVGQSWVQRMMQPFGERNFYLTMVFNLTMKNWETFTNSSFKTPVMSKSIALHRFLI